MIPRVVALAALAVALLVGLAVWGAYQVADATDAVTVAQEDARQRLRIIQSLADAHVHFKLEVEDWKDLLLDGGNVRSLRKQQERFEHEAALVSERLVATEGQLRAARLDAADTNALRLAHLALLQKYRDAMRQFDLRTPTGARRADTLLKGIDRATNARFDDVALAVDREAGIHQDKLVNIARAEARISWWSVLDAASFAVALAVGFAFWILRDLVRAVLARIR